MTPFGDAQTQPEDRAPAAILWLSRTRMRARRVPRSRRLWVGVFLLALFCVPGDMTGQITPGDLVRVYDAHGTLVASGRVDSVTRDSLHLEPRANSVLNAFPADAFQDDSMWLAVRGPSKAGSTALYTGLGGALLGAGIGYCFDLFSDECSGNVEGALAFGAILGGVGAGLGALIGLTRHEWERARLEPVSMEARVGLAPYVAGGGRVGVTASFRF